MPIFHLKWKCFAFVKTENLVTGPLCLLCVIRLKKEVLSKKEGPSTCWWSFFDENIKTVFMAKHTHTLWWKATYLISRVSFLDNQNTRDIVNVKCTYVPWLPLTQIFLIAVSGCCHYETQTKPNDRVRTTPAPLQIDMTQIRKKRFLPSCLPMHF